MPTTRSSARLHPGQSGSQGPENAEFEQDEDETMIEALAFSKALSLSASEVSSASFLLPVDTYQNTEFPKVTIQNPRGIYCYFIAAVLSGILSLEAARDSCVTSASKDASDPISVFLRSIHQEIVNPLWNMYMGTPSHTLEITSETVSRLIQEAETAGWLKDKPEHEKNAQQDVAECFEFLHDICGLNMHTVVYNFIDKELGYIDTGQNETMGTFALSPTYDGGDQKVSLSVLVQAHFSAVDMIRGDRPTFQK
jgi:hypothetical protein